MDDANSERRSTGVLFKNDARLCLMKGIEIVAEAVGCTLGPRGKTVIIQQEGKTPIVTKDGVSVSKSIRLKDPVELMGCELIKQAAERTNDVAGDGTTTATVLTHAMIKDGMKLMSAGHDALRVCRGIEEATNVVCAELGKIAKHVNTPEEIKQVA